MRRPASSPASCGSPTAWSPRSSAAPGRRSGALRARLADRAPAARRARAARARGRDDDRAAVESERVRAAARAAGDLWTSIEPEEDHMGHLDPANPMWTGGDRMARDPFRRRGARRGRSAGGVPRAVRDHGRERDLPRRQLARPPPRRDARPPARARRPVGRRAGLGLAGLDRRADARRRSAGRARARRAAGRGDRRRLDDGEPLQAVQRRARRLAAAARWSPTRDNFPTDRYVLEGLAAQRGSSCGWSTATRDGAQLDGARGSCVALHVDYRVGRLCRHAGVTAAARAHGARSCGTSATRPARSDRPARRGVELAVGCTYKYLNAGPGAPAFLYVASELQAQLRSPIWGWFGQRDQFAMERRLRPGRRHRALPGRHAADPRPRRGRGGRRADRRGRRRRAAREVDRPDRADRRAARRLARAARLQRSARRATRRAAARTSRSATTRPGRSAAR